MGRKKPGGHHTATDTYRGSQSGADASGTSGGSASSRASNPSGGSKEKPRQEIPHLHVRPPQLAAAGAHADAAIVGNRAGLLRLRDQIDRALELEDGLASMHWNGYREIDGRVYGLMVHEATRPEQMGRPASRTGQIIPYSRKRTTGGVR